jgi:redox-sensing transcriptional repressor
MMYKGFSEFGLEIVAGFDPHPIGEVDGKPVYDVSKLASVVASSGATIGIITVPAPVAQSIADELVRAGIKGLWNFSPVHIVVPQAVAVKNENLAASLAVLSKQIK